MALHRRLSAFADPCNVKPPKNRPVASHPVKPLQNRSAVGIAVRCEPRKGGQQTHRLFLQCLVAKNTTQQITRLADRADPVCR